MKSNFYVVDDWYNQEIKIIKNTDIMSSQEVLFWGTEKECEEYMNSLRSINWQVNQRKEKLCHGIKKV